MAEQIALSLCAMGVGSVVREPVVGGDEKGRGVPEDRREGGKRWGRSGQG